MPSKDAQGRGEALKTRIDMYRSAERMAAKAGYTVYPYIFTAGKTAPAPGKRYCFAVTKIVAEVKNDADAAKLKNEPEDTPSGTEEHHGVEFHVFEKEPNFPEHVQVLRISINYSSPEVAMQAFGQRVPPQVQPKPS